MEISKKDFLKLPQEPGVYTFLKDNKPIYIGKSINLKSRLNSYLLPNLGVKTKKMVNLADSLTFIKVNSDLESLLLESFLIRKYKPKYNIVLKDDKNPLYIVITNDPLPRIIHTRKPQTLSYKYVYGPFPSSSNVKSILRIVRKIFPYSDHKLAKKRCLYSHMKLCDPCPNVIGSIQSVTFKKEQTRRYIKNINNIKLILSRKFNLVRRALQNEMQQFSKQTDFERAKETRDKIKILDYITQEKISTEKFIENPNLIEDIRSNELNSLQKILKNNKIDVKKLKRIECYDISHLQGLFVTASMVVMIKGQIEKSEYRHFKIIQPKGQSDYDSMREVARRRIKYLDKWGRPDLIIVDGGLGQVKIFSNEFKSDNVSVVGIAKNPDRLVFENGTRVKLSGFSLNITARIRDEAHRFARRLHHKLLTESFN